MFGWKNRMGGCVELDVLILTMSTVCQSEIVCACMKVRKLGPRSINKGWGPLVKFICKIQLYYSLWDIESTFGVIFFVLGGSSICFQHGESYVSLYPESNLLVHLVLGMGGLGFCYGPIWALVVIARGFSGHLYRNRMGFWCFSYVAVWGSFYSVVQLHGICVVWPRCKIGKTSKISLTSSWLCGRQSRRPTWRWIVLCGWWPFMI